MTKTGIGMRRKVFAAILVVAVALAFSPLAATTAHAATLGEMEPNDCGGGYAYSFAYNTGSAKDIASGNTYAGSFASTDDYEWFKFTLGAETAVTFLFSRVASPGVSSTQSFASFTICNSAGTYQDSASLNGAEANVYLTPTLAAGTYYVKIAPSSYVTAGGTCQWAFSFTNKGLITRAYVPTEMFLSSTYKNGAAYVKKSISVYCGSKELVNGTDYSVSVSNSSKAGPSTVKVTGKGKYYGTLSYKLNKYISTTYMSASANFSKKTIKIKLSKVYGATGYIIKYKYPGKKWKSKKVTKTTYTLKKVPSLKNGKKFSFQVIAFAKVGKKTYYSRTYASSAKAWYKTSYKVTVY
jgi:hypothetical protein